MEVTHEPLYRLYYVADEHRRRRHTASLYRLRRQLRSDRNAAE